MKKYLFDVEVLVRDGESFFSLCFKDVSIISDNKFDAYQSCQVYVLNFLNSCSCEFFNYVIVRMECD